MSFRAESGAVIDGRFVLSRKLGAGGFGVVWQALDRETGADVAIKLMLGKLVERERLRERFMSEVAVLEKLAHPNIARAIASGVAGDRPYLALEYLDGVTLEQLIAHRAKKDEHFAIVDVLRLFEMLASGVAHAHAHGIVHRDVKPRNVIVIWEGAQPVLKLLDFGIAKQLEQTETQATTVGRLLGSLHYLSPEQALGRKISATSDVFALGVILFELLTLRKIWLRDAVDIPLSVWSPDRKSTLNGQLAVLERITSGTRPQLSVLRPNLPEGLDAVIQRALAIAPEKRHETADALLAEVRAACADALEPEDATVVVSPLSAREDSRLVAGELQDWDVAMSVALPAQRRLDLLLGSAALLAALAALSLFLYSKRPEPVLIPVDDVQPPPRVVALAVAKSEEAARPVDLQPAHALALRKARVREEPARGEAVRAEPAPAPAEEPRAIADLRRRLSALRADPTNADASDELSRRIRALAERVRDPRAKTAIERRAEASTISGDISGFEWCIDALAKEPAR